MGCGCLLGRPTARPLALAGLICAFPKSRYRARHAMNASSTYPGKWSIPGARGVLLNHSWARAKTPRLRLIREPSRNEGLTARARSGRRSFRRFMWARWRRLAAHKKIATLRSPVTGYWQPRDFTTPPHLTSSAFCSLSSDSLELEAASMPISSNRDRISG